MLPGADFFDLFADEFTGLGGGGLSFALIPARTFDSLFLWHKGFDEFAGEVVGGCVVGEGVQELQETGATIRALLRRQSSF
jgi:hypothetical protein